jgi:restriction endonuclease Mrr
MAIPDFQSLMLPLLKAVADSQEHSVAEVIETLAQTHVNTISQKIVLIDGEQLAQLMIDHGIGVTKVANYIVKRVDSDYFSEE